MANIEVVSHIPETLEELHDKMKTAMKAVSLDMEGEAKLELASDPQREDTGLLKNSIASGISKEATSISAYSADRTVRKDGSKAEITSGSYGGNLPDDGEQAVAAYVGTNVKYAKYVHDGTSRMTANRFLRNALQNNIDRFKAIIEENLK